MKQLKVSTRSIIYFTLVIYMLFSSCTKHGANEPNSEEQGSGAMDHHHNNNNDQDFHNNHRRLSFKTFKELLQVRAATKKYRDINNARDDQYEETTVIIQNMGFHFFKAEFASPTFDLTKPAFLVYNKTNTGKFELVAVEYGVPIDPNNPFKAPEGFTGHADVWDRNTLNSGLWTLHAWVWKFNPDGVFNMMNPNVIVPGL